MPGILFLWRAFILLAKDEHFWQLPLENVVGARKEVLDVLFIFPGQTDLISSLFFQTRSSHLHFLALLPWSPKICILFHFVLLADNNKHYLEVWLKWQNTSSAGTGPEFKPLYHRQNTKMVQ
jgi:hypothetical protein